VTRAQTGSQIVGRKTLPRGATVCAVVRSAKKPVDSRTTVIERQREAECLAKLTAKTVHTSPARRDRLLALLDATPGAGADTQAERMLRALRDGPITSHEARQFLDVIHPAGRIKSLRDEGHDILTGWVIQTSACGKPHRIGRWSLIR
jgi:hypothetical protein